MPPVNFKLTRNDQTRRLGFSDLPTWDTLAAKIEALYGIFAGSVGVSYIDKDDDEITASSNDELQDFYQSTHQAGQPIKFRVLDLNATQESGGKTAQVNESGNTNPFGRDDPNFDFPESDWQRLGPFNVAEFVDALSEGPHAFVEILDSDVSGFTKDPEEINETSSDDAQSTVQPTYIDKGKRKASSSSLAAVSVTSVVDEDFAHKFPVHVADHGSLKPQTVPPATKEDPSISILAESTPKSESAKPIHEEGHSSAAGANEIEDPPLPSIESTPSYASANLSHDIATLLTNFTGIISSHPELSEGVRNIVQNATTGAYWQTHRAALSQAANELQQTGSQIEEEAARRVSEALGSIFRTLSITEGNNSTTSPPTAQSAPQQGNNPFNSSSAHQYDFRQNFPWVQPPFYARRSFPNRSTPGPDGWNFFPRPPWASGMMHHPPPGPPPPPPPPGFPPHHAPSFPPPPPPMFNMHPPPPPPPPRRPVVVPIVPTPVAEAQVNTSPPPSQGNGIPDPSPSQPFVENVYDTVKDADHSSDVPDAKLKRSSVGPDPVGSNDSPYHRPGPDISQLSLRHQELRDRVEEAKRQYKAQKEAYRKEREERRKEKEARNGVLRDGEDKINAAPDFTRVRVPTVSADSWSNVNGGQVISHSWTPFLQTDLSGIPRRHNTHLGHGSSSRRNDRKPEDLGARAQFRIAKRLSDMGFSENSHPSLPEKIKKQMPMNKVLSKEEEDDIVTNLLEELLAQGTKPANSPKLRGWEL